MARLLDVDSPRSAPGTQGSLPASRSEAANAARLRTAFVLVLLAATAGAFVLAERLKLEPSPLRGVRVTKVFSPVCRCATDTASISFRLREPDSVTILITNRTGRSVRRLASRERVGTTPRTFTWDGRSDAGAVVPDGVYRARVHIRGSGRIFDLPNRIVVDTKPPAIAVARTGRRTISPDGDGRADGIVIPYRVDEPAETMLYVDGVRRIRVKGMDLAHRVRWGGRIDGRVRTGTHRLRIVSRDRAGNVSRAAPVTVRVRFVELPHAVFLAHPRARLRIGVDTDVRTVRWRLGARRGRGSAHPLVLRAPDRPGRYALVVRAGPHSARATMRVTRGPIRPLR